jgi:hypothetical protein
MNFNADQVGRHILLFVVNNQPSNVVIVDVFAQAQPGSVSAIFRLNAALRSATIDILSVAIINI